MRPSAPDTAFTVKLVDIDPSGRAVHVSDGVATLRRPPRAAGVIAYAPGTQRTVTVNLYPNEWVFLERHRAGVWISSSLYPTFSAHTNTERPWYLETSPRIAHQTVEVGTGTSRVILPIVGEAPVARTAR